jgi:hypothetical protein
VSKTSAVFFFFLGVDKALQTMLLQKEGMELGFCGER